MNVWSGHERSNKLALTLLDFFCFLNNRMTIAAWVSNKYIPRVAPLILFKSYFEEAIVYKSLA